MAEENPTRGRISGSSPAWIGPYRVIDELGHGGMGVVYRAEQREPIRRIVAVKVLRAGLATADVLARFELERRALAAMSHRCIAKVLDAGATEGGEPWFAMELVEGLPMAQYCDQHRLDLEQRLTLFRLVCDGVQHAHQKGVVHRDLKPGNVLVVLEGDTAVPKIVDFGLAKATNHDFLATAVLTEPDWVLGTPEYMSPEQAAGDGETVDARSDIYSLGVMLYDLLCGELPFPTAQLRSVGRLEALRRIREDEPKRPSASLAARRDRDIVAATRRTSPAALRRALTDDLDWVVLQAMAKEPERRYAAVSELSADVGRYLDLYPVLARPPSAAYRLQKYLRRHRGRVIGAASVLVALLCGLILAGVQWQRAVLASERYAAKVRDFELLAGSVHFRRALATERELFPAWPDKIPAMVHWLQGIGGQVLSMRPDIEQTAEGLRARSLPQNEEERLHDRETHPRFEDLSSAERDLSALQHAERIRAGGNLVLPQLGADEVQLSIDELEDRVWQRVTWPVAGRTRDGEEPLGLALATAAERRAAGTDRHASCLAALAWAFFANGMDAEARARSAAAIAAAADANKYLFEARHRRLLAAIDDFGASLQRARKDVADLAQAVGQRHTWRFPAEDQTVVDLHEALTDLLPRLGQLEDLPRRLLWAQCLQDGLTSNHPRARVSWSQARQAIAASPKYGGHVEMLADDAVVGLVPIGANPVTGLWEFYDLRSAWDGANDPRDLPIPEHEPNGRIVMGEHAGIVLVLLPGGAFTMGAQATDPTQPAYDPMAAADEAPPYTVILPPFLISRFETTRGQWRRMFGEDPSYYGGDDNCPVENVTWEECAESLPRMGLALPTEPQWEYAARGGSTCPWSSVDDPSLLAGMANLADRQVRANGMEPSEDWDDGHLINARVGCYAFQDFGLHDVHGNVSEWCADDYRRSYAPTERQQDGVYVVRGGNHTDLAKEARVTFRNFAAAHTRGPGLGVRVVRPLPSH